MSAPTNDEECIHGLEAGVCDICFPKARPEPVRTVTTRTPRTSSSLRSTASGSRAASRPVDVSARRIYHVTHLDNLAFIAESGALLAGAEPAVDLSAPAVREARGHIQTPNGLTVADHVPFFATIDASLWEAIVAGDSDPRLSQNPFALDFAILVTSMGTVPDAVVADGDAAHPLTRFAGPETAGRMFASLSRDISGRALDAEVLVPHRVPLEALTVVTVANDRAQRIAKEAGITTRVAIHPPWFQLKD